MADHPIAPESRDRSANRVLAWIALVGPIVFVAGVVIGAAVTPDYSHRVDTISELAAFGRPYPAIQMTNFVVFGSGMIAAGVALWRRLDDRSRSARIAEALVVLAGINMILTGIFRTDPFEQEVASTSGVIHMATSSIIFLALIAAFVLLGRAFGRDRAWSGLSGFSMTDGILAAVFLVVFGVSVEAMPEWKGLWQRGLAGTIVAWFTVVGWRLVAVTRQHQAT